MSLCGAKIWGCNFAISCVMITASKSHPSLCGHCISEMIVSEIKVHIFSHAKKKNPFCCCTCPCAVKNRGSSQNTLISLKTPANHVHIFWKRVSLYFFYQYYKNILGGHAMCAIWGYWEYVVGHQVSLCISYMCTGSYEVPRARVT